MMNPLKLKSTNSAFTLVEALVALGIFAVGMAALMPLAITNMRGTSNASVRTHALALAQETIEEKRSVLFSDLQAVGYVSAPVTLDSVYTRQWSVIADPVALTGDDEDIRRLRVVVSWSLPDTSGDVTLVTTKTRY